MNNTTKNGDGEVDWAAVRERLSQAETAMEEALNPPPERARAIMDTRAAALAQVPPAPRAQNEYLDVVLVGLGAEHLAIETCYVIEVIRMTAITPVPYTSDWIVGVVNLRGNALAVIDLRRIFDMASAETADAARILVLGTARAEFGVLVDDAQTRTQIAIADVLAPGAETSGIGADCIRGVTREALIVLDGAALLKDKRLTAANHNGPGG